MLVYTLVILNLDRTDAFCEYVTAETPRSAYEQALRELHAGTEPEPDLYPFNLAEAEADRPLLAVFEGAHTNLAA